MESEDQEPGSEQPHDAEAPQQEQPPDMISGQESDMLSPPSDGDVLSGAVPPADKKAATTESEAPATATQPKPGFREWLSAHWGPYRRWRWYRESHGRDDVTFWIKHDPEENRAGKLPSDERVELPCIWVAELYTPSTITGLLNGIADLGWEHGKMSDQSLLKWMADVRHGRRAGWVNLGLVSPRDKPHFARDREAELPEGVQVAFPAVMSLTPGVTAFVMQFVLDDETAMSLEPALRAEYNTYLSNDPLFRRRHLIPHVLWNRSARLGRQIHRPDVQRRDAVRARLADLETRCTKWVRRFMPGVFAHDEGRQNPTAFLFVAERARPLHDETRRMRAFEGLGIDRDYDAWGSEEWPGGRLVLPRGWDGDVPRLVFGCRRSDAFPERPGYADPESNWTIAQRANDYVQGLLTRFAVSTILNAYHQTLSILRDKIAREESNRPVRALRELRELARTESFDIEIASREIKAFAESRWYSHDVIEMKYVEQIRGEHPDLLKELQAFQKERASQVAEESRLLLTTLSTTSNVTQTISNIRIQRLLIGLTVISVGIAIAALLIARGAGS
jgi:hypothetical protein